MDLLIAETASKSLTRYRVLAAPGIELSLHCVHECGQSTTSVEGVVFQEEERAQAEETARREGADHR